MLPGPGSSLASPKRINPVHIQEVPVRVEAKSVPVTGSSGFVRHLEVSWPE